MYDFTEEMKNNNIILRFLLIILRINRRFRAVFNHDKLSLLLRYNLNNNYLTAVLW